MQMDSCKCANIGTTDQTCMDSCELVGATIVNQMHINSHELVSTNAMGPWSLFLPNSTQTTNEKHIMCASMNSSPPYNNIHWVLILPEVPTWSTWQVPTKKPFIDYNMNIMMTFDHYVIRLEQKLLVDSKLNPN
jgi:hypothetical protein